MNATHLTAIQQSITGARTASTEPETYAIQQDGITWWVQTTRETASVNGRNRRVKVTWLNHSGGNARARAFQDAEPAEVLAYVQEQSAALAATRTA